MPDGLAVADHLGVDRFVAVGVSTGGAYALALAAVAPDRVIGAVPACAMTDMRWPEGRATMSPPHTHALWDAPDRATALQAAVEAHGDDGSKLLVAASDADADGPTLAPSDLGSLTNPDWLAGLMASVPAMFAFGNEGYTDDRLADGPGWGSFDVTAITCPVIVVHGESDIIVAPSHARHTAELVPGAELRIFDGLGHFSAVGEVLPAVADILDR